MNMSEHLVKWMLWGHLHIVSLICFCPVSHFRSQEFGGEGHIWFVPLPLPMETCRVHAPSVVTNLHK